MKYITDKRGNELWYFDNFKYREVIFFSARCYLNIYLALKMLISREFRGIFALSNCYLVLRRRAVTVQISVLFIYLAHA